MPDTLSRYRWRHEDCDPTACVATDEQGCETTQLLAHIDALTAAVAALPVLMREIFDGEVKDLIDRAAVLAILRGEQ